MDRKKIEPIQNVLIYVIAIVIFILLHRLGRYMRLEGTNLGNIHMANFSIVIGITAYVILGISTGLNRLLTLFRSKVKLGYHFVQVIVVSIILISIAWTIGDTNIINACLFLGGSCIMSGFYQTERRSA